MAANPYIVEYDDPTTAQELSMWKFARSRISQSGQSYQMNIGGGNRMFTAGDLAEINRTIESLERKLELEEMASAGDGGAQNLVRFVRAS